MVNHLFTFLMLSLRSAAPRIESLVPRSSFATRDLSISDEGTTMWARVLIDVPRWIVYLLASALFVLVTVTDLATGYELDWAIFYLLPLLLLGWSGETLGGLVWAILCGFGSVSVDLLGGHPYSSRWIVLWDIATRTGIFTIVVTIVARLRHALDEHKRRAQTDGLTGILNSRGFIEVLSAEVDRAKRYSRPVSLAYLDIDDFKRVNDTLGHGAGNKLLAAVAQALAKNVRKADVVARLGGDEFVILLPETTAEQAENSLARLRDRLLEAARIDGPSPTFSIGLVTCQGPACDAEELLQHADRLMYEVKGSGKDGVRFEKTT